METSHQLKVVWDNFPHSTESKVAFINVKNTLCTNLDLVEVGSDRGSEYIC